MADQPAAPAPEPAKQPDAAPAKKGGAAGPFIAGFGCSFLLFLIALVGALIFGGGGGLSEPSSKPDLSSPESAAKTKALFDKQKEVILLVYGATAYLKHAGDAEEDLQWLADKAETEKQLKKQRAQMEFVKLHAKELLDLKAEVTKTGEGTSTKTITVKITGKRVMPDGDNWKLDDLSEEHPVTVNNIENKWWVKE
jgi:hypothetical protein